MNVSVYISVCLSSCLSAGIGGLVAKALDLCQVIIGKFFKTTCVTGPSDLVVAYLGAV